ncbi:unnamed protein product [Schistosoma turkestanicum]|nr:unnamed protein product [Schistosoma turkestanicum]CAH8435738.1 unnamed protein product [Schistosoma turkestanicum]
MTSVMSITVGSVVVCVIVINLDARGEKLSRAPKWLRRISKLGIFKLFYKENCYDVNESAGLSSIIGKLLTSNLNQEKKLLEIDHQISALSKLNHLLDKNKMLTEEIRSICQNYFSRPYLKEKFSSNTTPSSPPVYHHNIIVKKSLNHSNPVHSHLISTPSKINSSSAVPVPIINSTELNHPILEGYKFCNSMQQNYSSKHYLPSKILCDNNNNNDLNTTLSNIHDLSSVNKWNFTNQVAANTTTTTTTTRHELIKYEWKVIAKITDRLLFVCFVLITIICYVAIFVWPLLAGSSMLYRKNY